MPCWSFATLLKWRTQRNITAKNKLEEKDLDAENIFEITPEIVQEHHVNKKSKRKLTVVLGEITMINNLEERIVQSKNFFSTELQLHNKNKSI